MNSSATENAQNVPAHPLPHRRLRGKARLKLWRHRYQKLGWVAICLIVIAALVFWGYERADHVTENDARVKADMLVVSSRVDGWVTERPGDEGSAVRQGDLLAVIDSRDSQLKLDELRAKAESVRLRQQRAAALLTISSTTTRGAVTAALAQQSSLRSQLAQAKREFARANALLDKTVSREQWEVRQSQLQQLEAAERAANSAVLDAQAKLGELDVLNKESATLAQELLQMGAQIQSRAIDLADRKIRSPIDGVIDKEFVLPGEYVAPGQRLLMLHNPKAVWVQADIKETKLDTLKLKQRVDLRVDAYPGRRFTGYVERIGTAATAEFALLPSPNPSGNFTKVTQRVPIRIAVEQPADNPLRPGMMVEVDIDTAVR